MNKKELIEPDTRASDFPDETDERGEMLGNDKFNPIIRAMFWIVIIFICFLMFFNKDVKNIKLTREGVYIPTKAEQKVFMDAYNKPLWETTTGHAIEINQDKTVTGYAIKVQRVEDNYNKAIYYFQKQMECNSKFDDNIELYMQTHDYKYVKLAKKYNKLAKTYCDSLQIIAKQK